MRVLTFVECLVMMALQVKYLLKTIISGNASTSIGWSFTKNWYKSRTHRCFDTLTWRNRGGKGGFSAIWGDGVNPRGHCIWWEVVVVCSYEKSRKVLDCWMVLCTCVRLASGVVLTVQEWSECVGCSRNIRLFTWIYE